MVARSGSSGRAQLVHLNELLGGVVELDENMEKERHYLSISLPAFSSLPLSPWPEFSLRECVYRVPSFICGSHHEFVQESRDACRGFPCKGFSVSPKGIGGRKGFLGLLR